MEKQLSHRQYLALNPKCTYEQFFENTGGSKQAWYSARYLLRQRLNKVNKLKPGPKPKAKQSDLFQPPPLVPTPKVKPAPEVQSEPKKTTEQTLNSLYENVGVTPDKSRTTLGITPDFIWYESAMIRTEVNAVLARNLARFEHLVRVMEERDKEKNDMLDDLLNKNRTLRKRNAELEHILDVETTPKAE
jgi:hypothetical protein